MSIDPGLIKKAAKESGYAGIFNIRLRMRDFSAPERIVTDQNTKVENQRRR